MKEDEIAEDLAENIYDEEYVEELLENDQIEGWEAGFMAGYNELGGE
jgi:hypothetical protein